MSRRQTDLFPELPDGKKYVSDYPDLAAEWHPTKNGEKLPEDVLHRSGKSIWWRCTKESSHEWKVTPNTRNRKLASGCPFCAGNLPTETHNLEALYPDLMQEWDYKKNKKPPNLYSPRSGLSFWWKCSKNPDHKWKTRVADRTRKDLRGCPYCSGKQASPEYNLATIYPTLVGEWHYKKNSKLPSDYPPKSHSKVW